MNQPYEEAINASPVDPNPETPEEKELPIYDNATLYGAAMVSMRQCMLHTLLSRDLKKTLEARKAHKFVAMNSRANAISILMLSGDLEDNCITAVDEIAAMLSKDEGAIRKLKSIIFKQQMNGATA